MRKKAVISLVLLSLAAAGCGRQADSVASSAAASLEEAASQDTPASLEESVSRDASAPGTLIEKIELVKRGDVRRAKLNYMRQRTGKSAKIKAKVLTDEQIAAEAAAEAVAKAEAEARLKAEEEAAAKAAEQAAAEQAEKAAPAEEAAE